MRPTEIGRGWNRALRGEVVVAVVAAVVVGGGGVVGGNEIEQMGQMAAKE